MTAAWPKSTANASPRPAMTALLERGDAALGMRAPAGIGLPGIIDSSPILMAQWRRKPGAIAA
eukprot:gene26342-32908_t